MKSRIQKSCVANLDVLQINITDYQIFKIISNILRHIS